MKYCLTISHLLTIAMLMLSSWVYSGTKWLSFFAVYILCFILITYVFHEKIAVFAGKAVSRFPTVKSFEGPVIWLVLLLLFAYPIAFFFAFGEIPLGHVILNNDFLDITRYRSTVSYDIPTYLSYSKQYYLHGFAPFCLLFFYHKRSKWFYPLLAFTIFFALNMIAKSYVLILLLPLMVFQAGKKKWLEAAGTTFVMIFSVAMLVYVTNPQIHSGNQAITAEGYITSPYASGLTSSTVSASAKIGSAIFTRLFQVPGQVTDEWLSIVPYKIPFLSGCGYRALAPLLGCDFVSMPKVVYDLTYPEMVEEHQIRGTVTASSFVNDYVNFGIPGIILSAVLTSMLLALVESLSRNYVVLLALNIMSILLLTETTLSSTLHTGGMVLINVLYIFTRSQFLDSEINSVKSGVGRDII